MRQPTKLTATAVTHSADEARRPRTQVIAEAWLALGDGVAPLSNGSGRPLARTVKLILDPLVIRPVQNPSLANGTLTKDASANLQALIEDAKADLNTASAWFVLLKRTRRQLRITAGNPQDLYFQRSFELARTHGAPGDNAEAAAVETVSEIARVSGDSLLSRVSALLRDPVEAARLHALLSSTWQIRTAPAESTDAARATDTAALVSTALNSLTEESDPSSAFSDLLAAAAGTESATEIGVVGAAQALGLTMHPLPVAPDLGKTASKRDLSRPFDRSIFERLFAALASGTHHHLDLDAEGLIEDEIDRSARPWELAVEPSRVVMVLGVEASRALESTPLLRLTSAHRLLLARWEREAYVRRVLRLPPESSGVPEPILGDIRSVRQGYLRRLWVRLHGRELRDQPIIAANLWDTLDGVLRSVIMDQRQRLKLAIGRDQSGVA